MLLTPPRATPRAVVGAAVGVGGLAAVAAAVATGSPLLLALCSALVAALTLAGAPALLLVRRPPGRLPVVRAAGVVTALLTGTAALLIGVQRLVTAETPPYPSAGDLFGLAATPFAVVMVFAVPRSGGDAVRLTRLLPLALLVGSAASLVVWGMALLGDGPPSVGAVLAGATVMAAVSTITLSVAGAVMGRERAMMVLVAGG